MRTQDATWAEVHPGDTLIIKGLSWTVDARDGDTVTMTSPGRPTRTGTPSPGGVVTRVVATPEQAVATVSAVLGAPPPCPACGGTGIEGGQS